jgi:hypothetical protein
MRRLEKRPASRWPNAVIKGPKMPSYATKMIARPAAKSFEKHVSTLFFVASVVPGYSRVVSSR